MKQDLCSALEKEGVASILCDLVYDEVESNALNRAAEDTQVAEINEIQDPSDAQILL